MSKPKELAHLVSNFVSSRNKEHRAGMGCDQVVLEGVQYLVVFNLDSALLHVHTDSAAEASVFSNHGLTAEPDSATYFKGPKRIAYDAGVPQTASLQPKVQQDFESHVDRLIIHYIAMQNPE